MIEGIFPVPSIGEEFTDTYVPPMKSKIKYENKYNETIEKEDYCWTQPGWKEEFTKNCKNLAENPSPEQDFIEQILDQIKKYETLDEILHAIHNFLLQLMLVSIVFGSNTKCLEKLSAALAFPSYAH